VAYFFGPPCIYIGLLNICNCNEHRYKTTMHYNVPV